jgi:hypothetical protein
MSLYARINSLTLKVDNVIETDKSFFNERTASPGDTYDVANNQFKSISQYASWVFNNSTWAWEAPTAMPELVGDTSYEWNEDTTAWVEVT